MKVSEAPREPLNRCCITWLALRGIEDHFRLYEEGTEIECQTCHTVIVKRDGTFRRKEG